MDTELLGVTLVGEIESSKTHMVAAVHRPGPDQKLGDFRNTVNSALPFSIGMRPYVFLTERGWEISEALENTITASSVVTTNGLVNIRLRYSKPRVGILIDGNPVGFVFCNLESTVQDLLKEVKCQLPALYCSLMNSNACFLDRNGWPVGKGQEHVMSLIDIMSDCSVNVRINFKLEPLHPPQLPQVTFTPYSDSASDVPTSSLMAVSVPSTHSFGLAAIHESRERQERSGLKDSSPEAYFDNMKLVTRSFGYEILISYVHSEASDYALLLTEALEKLGYTVFLDTSCIKGGADWQDTLNTAIADCVVFVPLITTQYGETLWTNREVKLADILGKFIMPVNFQCSWPPKCLAIQFATIQYIAWTRACDKEVHELEDESHIAASVAAEIAGHYRSRYSTQTSCQLQAVEGTLESTGITKPISRLMKKVSSLKSYAGVLPDSLPEVYRKSIQEARDGRPLVLIGCHSAQKELTQDIASELRKKRYEVWSSCAIGTSDNDVAQRIFQEKADEAGVVVFVISNDFVNSSFCEQQVYYCEHRKRIIPLLCGAIQLPHWLSVLVGTSTFIDCRAATYKSALFDRIEVALNPIKAEQDMKEVLKRNTEVTKMCCELSDRLPKGINVYISGGTKFYSSCGKAICEELGRQLAQHPEINIITGGFFGVGDTVARSFYNERLKLSLPHGVCHIVAVRDDHDRSPQTNQNPDGTFPPVSYGDTLFFGSSVRQREMLTARVLDLCILIEGGPGAAFEAQQFCWNGNQVIPVKVTGGAAGGLFSVPQSILKCPPHISLSNWSVLADANALPCDVAAAILRIVKTLKLITSSDVVKRKITGLYHDSKSKLMKCETMPVDST